MNQTPPPSAQRNLRAFLDHMSQPPLLGILVLVSALVTLAGPFDTLVQMDMAMRAVYWTITVFATYTMGALSTQMLGTVICWRVKPAALALTLTGILVSVCIFTLLVTLNGLMLENWAAAPNTLPTVYIFVLIISLTIVFTRHKLFGEVGVPHKRLPLILERLPLDKRGKLISLSVQDHYVNIVTDKGREMILMRLSDAMREASEINGLQIHRSHWVALGQITNAERAGDAAKVTMSDGSVLPVSRSYLPKLRDTGLLPAGRSPRKAS